MPGEAEEPLGVHPLDGRLPLDVLVAGIRHPPARRPSGGERAVHLCMEPLAEFDVVREGAPDPGKRRLELDPFLDAICVHKQPFCCMSFARQGNWRKRGRGLPIASPRCRPGPPPHFCVLYCARVLIGPTSTRPSGIGLWTSVPLFLPKYAAAAAAMASNSLLKSFPCSRMLNRVSQSSLAFFCFRIIWKSYAIRTTK